MELRRAPRVQSVYRVDKLPLVDAEGNYTAARRLKLRLFEVFLSSEGGLEVSSFQTAWVRS